MDLFDESKAVRREELKALGWYEAWGNYWRKPNGDVVTEDTAFDWLDKHKKEKTE
jgi:hypothetical protein